MSPTHTEMLFAIGAGDQVVAVDNLSNFPAEAAAVVTDLSAYEPNVEAVAGYEPDLVVTDGTNPDFLAQLDSLDIPHWEGTAAVGLGDVYDQIEQLGAMTGHVAEAAELVAQMQTDVDEIVAAVPPTEAPLSYYHELDDTYFSRHVGHVHRSGLLAARAAQHRRRGRVRRRPVPAAERRVHHLDQPGSHLPRRHEVLRQNAETVAARPGWDAITAVTDGAVIALDDDIASRWGPRVVDLLRTVADAVTQVAAPA